MPFESIHCAYLTLFVSLNSGLCLYEQQSSDTTLISDDNSRRGFISAFILPQDQGLLCATSDQQFFFYNFNQTTKKEPHLMLYRRLVGYNEEIIDLKFVDDDEQLLAVATNLEEVLWEHLLYPSQCRIS